MNECFDVFLSFVFVLESCIQFSRCMLAFPAIQDSDRSGSRIIGKTFKKVCWRPPALPRRLQRSTIGRLRLNHRVRNGNGCAPQAHRHQQVLSCHLNAPDPVRQLLRESLALCPHVTVLNSDFATGLSSLSADVAEVPFGVVSRVLPLTPWHLNSKTHQVLSYALLVLS